MATYVKFNSWIDAALKTANIGTDTFKVVLTNTAPNASSNTVLADITQISNGNGYTTGGTTATTTSSTTTSGTCVLILADVVFTATGSMGPFRYAVLYDDTPTSPAKPLVAYWDYGSSVTLASTETFTTDFDSGNGVFQAS